MLTNHTSFVQLVKSATRGQRILDVFLTNVPHFWKKIKVEKSLVRSDHNMVLVYPREVVKADRREIFFRDVRCHNQIKMMRELEHVDWDVITSREKTSDEMVNTFYEIIYPLFEKCFPRIRVKLSSRDPPFISPLVKHLLNLRKKATAKHDLELSNQLQEKINSLIRENQMRVVRQEHKNHKMGSKKWWETVNSITSRTKSNIPVSAQIDPNDINVHFQKINTDCDYKPPNLCEISESTRIPTLSTNIVRQLLEKQRRTAAGPDDLPFWFWKNFSLDLAPVITIIFNRSLIEGTVPNKWKKANILPLPKESPLETCNQLRPISLTAIIMRLFERCVYKSELSHVSESIGKDQFAYKKGQNSTMALIKCQYKWLKWLDSEASYVRIFSFDFRKAFDSVPHDILCLKLKSLNINPYIVNWITNLLTNREQRVVVDGIVTNYLHINRGVPQGTVLGPFLFSIMANEIKPIDQNNELIKFADDMTLGVPGTNGSDTSNIEVNNIIKWSETNRMPLNMRKTWEMVIHGNSNEPIPNPIPAIERKTWLEILGTILQENPCNWDMHFHKLISKASSRMYIMRVCKYYGMSSEQLDLLFDSLVMSVLTYGVELWGCAHYNKYLRQIDKLVARAHKYSYTSKNYSIEEIIRSRDKKLWDKVTSNVNNPLHELLPNRLERPLRPRGHNYELPLIRTERFKNSYINRCLFNFI